MRWRTKEHSVALYRRGRLGATEVRRALSVSLLVQSGLLKLKVIALHLLGNKCRHKRADEAQPALWQAGPHTRAVSTPSLAVLGWEVKVQKVVHHGVRKEVGASPDHHSVHDPATTAGALAELEPGVANVQFNVPVELKHAALVVYGQRYRHLRELGDTGQLGPTPKQCWKCRN